MPIYLSPEQGESGGGPAHTGQGATDYGYSYPDGLDLRPGSPLHDYIVSQVTNRADESFLHMKSRHDSWNDIDKTLTAYQWVDKTEQELKTKDSRKPVSIVIPDSFAALETIMTYLVMAFMYDRVIFQYEGAGPEDVVPATLMEIAVASQTDYFKAALALHTQFRDDCAYGFGVTVPGWTSVTARRTVKQQRGIYSGLGRLLGRRPTKTRTEEQTVYEGTEILNIDPYLYLPDTNYAVHEVQKFEHVGWFDGVGIMDLLDDDAEGRLFNVKHLQQKMAARNIKYLDKLDARGIRSGVERSKLHSNYSRPFEITNQYVKVIPNEFGPASGQKLGQGDLPEKWFFSVANHDTLIRAQPLGLDHGRFPVSVIASSYDGYSVAPTSRLEIAYGLQHLNNWLFNSHIKNIRKAINDMLVVDPSMVNWNDVVDTKEGKLIRLRRAAWGRGVKDVVAQLNVHDVTQNHIRDSDVVHQIHQRVTGATDSAMGIPKTKGERMSASEVKAVMSSTINRLTRLAKVISIMGMRDLAMFHASHAQQLMSLERYHKVVGDWPKVLQQEYGSRVPVGPMDILCQYDVITGDGSLPIDVGGQVENYNRLLQVLAQFPYLAGQLDTARIVLRMMRMSGEKDVQEFLLNKPISPEIVSGEQLEKQSQAGNVIPISASGA